jgi:hypothetical protein
MVGVADGCWVLGIRDVVLDYACLEADVGREVLCNFGVLRLGRKSKGEKQLSNSKGFIISRQGL